MPRLADESTLQAYRFLTGSLYHVVCGSKAEYKEGPHLSGEDRWTCKTCITPDSPWTTSFTLNQTKERGWMPVTNTWVFLDSSDIAEEVFFLETHAATKDEFKNTYTYLRPTTMAEKCRWFRTMLLEQEKRNDNGKRD